MKKSEEIINQCLDFLLANADKNLIESIILTGSFARGEEVVICFKDNLKFFSDIEFLIIIKDSLDFKYAKNKFKELAKDFTEKSAESGSGIDVTFGVSTIEVLKKMKPRIFTYELKNFGKVLWGNKTILDCIPLNNNRDIPVEDAMRLLFNRMIEQLINYQNIIKTESFDTESALYQIGKGYLDIAKSFMVFRSMYEKNYLKMSEIINGLTVNNLDTKGLSAQVKYWAIFKTSPVELKKTKKEILDEWFRLANYFRQMWLWQSNIYLKQKIWVDNPLRLIKLYFVKEPKMNKFKGWIRFFMHPYLKRKDFSLIRILPLFVLASPERLIHLSGVMAYLYDDNYNNSITEYLPVFSNPQNKTQVDLKEKVIYNWQLFVKEG
ncbi:nucleotidyltransferase domain-containing protein [Candidatus Desantisbacteria bacterium]|nr:nucleotidyltransferase domain-containing protein [Candidatus Desantisbacteria bacterium]